mgnify:CR=1 FL=1
MGSFFGRENCCRVDNRQAVKIKNRAPECDEKRQLLPLVAQSVDFALVGEDYDGIIWAKWTKQMWWEPAAQ